MSKCLEDNRFYAILESLESFFKKAGSGAVKALSWGSFLIKTMGELPLEIINVF